MGCLGPLNLEHPLIGGPTNVIRLCVQSFGTRFLWPTALFGVQVVSPLLSQSQLDDLSAVRFSFFTAFYLYCPFTPRAPNIFLSDMQGTFWLLFQHGIAITSTLWLCILLVIGGSLLSFSHGPRHIGFSMEQLAQSSIWLRFPQTTELCQASVLCEWHLGRHVFSDLLSLSTLWLHQK